MRAAAPDNFSIASFYEGIYCFQSWNVFPGHRTIGPKSVEGALEKLRFPLHIRGKRVLEIAPWNGFFSFECVRRGAAEVVALGPDDPNMTGFNKTRELLEIDNVSYIKESVYNIRNIDIGTFDIVLFLGVIYHLRYPLLALDLIHDVCVDRLYVDCPTIDNYGLIIGSESQKNVTRSAWGAVQNVPIIYYSQEDEVNARRDPFNWFLPNERALRDFVTSSGFAVDSFVGEPAFAYLGARKAARRFTFGLEGFNARASSR